MKIRKLLRALRGYKTYLSATGLVILAIFEIATGHVLMGLHTLFTAFAAGGLRHAIAVATTEDPND